MSAVSSALLLCAAAFAQPRFDVASIKPSQSVGIDFRLFPGGRLIITHQTVEDILLEAYGLNRYEIAGLPDWARSERWDIAAESEAKPDREQMLAMLRDLLEQRFGMKARRETKEGTVYALIAAKNGPKVSPPRDTSQKFIHMSREGAPTEAAISYTLDGRTATMAQLVAQLKGIVHKPVLDGTRIQTEFDFKLTYAADDSHADTAPSIFTALQDQLGLKLEPQKGPVDTFVIDHIERPSAN